MSASDPDPAGALERLLELLEDEDPATAGEEQR